MDFIAENFGGRSLVDPSWSKIELGLKQIDERKNSYCILTADSGSYLQCAGGQNEVSIEYREILKGGFNHYVLSRGPIERPLKTVWHNINCNVGPIRVHRNEVLTLEDAMIAFKFFLINSNVPPDFNKRNVTKQMTE